NVSPLILMLTGCSIPFGASPRAVNFIIDSALPLVIVHWTLVCFPSVRRHHPCETESPDDHSDRFVSENNVIGLQTGGCARAKTAGMLGNSPHNIIRSAIQHSVGGANLAEG